MKNNPTLKEIVEVMQEVMTTYNSKNELLLNDDDTQCFASKGVYHMLLPYEDVAYVLLENMDPTVLHAEVLRMFKVRRQRGDSFRRKDMKYHATWMVRAIITNELLELEQAITICKMDPNKPGAEAKIQYVMDYYGEYIRENMAYYMPYPN